MRSFLRSVWTLKKGQELNVPISCTSTRFKSVDQTEKEKTCSKEKHVYSGQKLQLKNNYLRNIYQNCDMWDMSKDNSRPEEEFANLCLDENIVEEKEKRNAHEIQRAESKKRQEKNLHLWNTVMDATGGEKAEFPHFKMFRNRPLTDATAVFHHNAWDNVEWDEEMRKKAEESVSRNTQTKMAYEKVEELEKDAGENWNKFYGIHQNKFFKDRNWLFTEFPELEGPFGCSVSKEDLETGVETKRANESYVGENSRFKVLEVGCGAGNTVFPLLDTNNNPELFLYCCDFSNTAVDIIRNHEKFDPGRCCPFVLDITDPNQQTPFPPGTLDIVILIFVISAVSPEKINCAIENVRKLLKPGGLVLLRDYGRFDMAQLRFRDGRCISDNFYMRGDGTRVYFFTPDELEILFTSNGLEKVDISVDRRLQVNRGKQLKMYRVWILAKFRRKK